MKLKQITTAALAVVGAGLLALPAQALTSYTTGDLLIGFSQSGNTQDYVIDIGPASTYLNATPGLTFNLSGLGNTAADLATVFGSGWASDSSVNWGVAGATPKTGTLFGQPANTLFISQDATAAFPPKQKSNSSQSTPEGKIDGAGGDFNNSTPTANSSVATIQATSDPNAWANYLTTGSNFGTGYTIVSQVTPDSSVLDLYELKPTNGVNGTLLGTFSLNDAGIFSFTSGIAAVPEPSTYAFLVLGLAFLLWRARRKSALSI